MTHYMRNSLSILVVMLTALAGCVEQPGQATQSLATCMDGYESSCSTCDRPPSYVAPTPIGSPTASPTPEESPTPSASPTEPTPFESPTPSESPPAEQSPLPSESPIPGDTPADEEHAPSFKDGKGNDCPGDYQVPAGCIALGGTTQDDMRWMECHRQQGSSLANVVNWTFATCPISTADSKAIIAACRAAHTRTEDILVCIGRKIKEKLMGDESNVCRHHAQCYRQAMINDNRDQNLQCGNKHCWDEVPTTGGGTYVMDSYNDIYYWCP